MKAAKLLTPALVITLILSSCQAKRFIYSPPPPNDPFFSEKGDSKLSAYLSTGPASAGTQNSTPKNQGFDVQGAYAIDSNWAVTGAFSSRNERDSYGDHYSNFFETSTVNYKRRIAEFGGGYFVAFSGRRKSFFSIYGGLGLGNYSFNDQGRLAGGYIYNRDHSVSVKKWYLQPSLYGIPGRSFSMGFTLRMSFMNYGRARTSYTDDERSYFSLDYAARRDAFFVEPTFHLAAGIPGIHWLKFDWLFTFCNDPYKDVQNLEARNFNMSMGITLNFSKMKYK